MLYSWELYMVAVLILENWTLGQTSFFVHSYLKSLTQAMIVCTVHFDDQLNTNTGNCGQPSPVTCKCKLPYAPDFPTPTDIMHFCLCLSCRQWYHQECLHYLVCEEGSLMPKSQNGKQGQATK